LTEVQQRERFAYLTALRGLAALIVAGGHVLGMPPPDHPSTTFFGASWGERLAWPWLFGRQMVWLFLILSGFALFWSESSRRSRNDSDVSWRRFAARRAWRIGPTYYAAVIFSLIVLACGRDVMLSPSQSLNTSIPVTPAGLLSHLFLLHNLSDVWILQISPPLWSIAIEVQLYLLLPLCFLRFWRSKPYIPVLFLIIVTHLIDRLTNTYLFGLMEWFGLGIVLAWALRASPIKRRWMFGTLSAVILVIAVLAGPAFGGGVVGKVLWALGLTFMIVTLHGDTRINWNGPLGRAIARLGEVSYSLYAIHFPIALAVWWAVGRITDVQLMQRALMVVISAPLILLVTLILYSVVERPSTEKAKSI